MRATMLVALALLMPVPVLAQAPDRWKIVPGMTSALLARSEGWQLITSSGLSWTDEKQAVVTFWTNGTVTMRCIDRFSSGMTPTSQAQCAQPVMAGE